MKLLPAAMALVAFMAVGVCIWALLEPSGAPEPERAGIPRGLVAPAPAPKDPGGAAATSRSSAELVPESTSAPTSRAARISGRVVTHEHDAVADAHVDIVLTRSDGSEAQFDTRSGGDGRFGVHLVGGRFVSASVFVSNSKRMGARDVAITGPIVGHRDLGDLELAPLKSIWFRILAAKDDTPVAGAVVCPPDRVWDVATADANGNGAIDVGPEVAELRVAAAGFQIVTVSLPPGEDSVVVRLDPASALTIRVLTSAGPANPDTTLIRVESDSGPCEVGLSNPLWIHLGNSVPVRSKNGALWFHASNVRLSSVVAGLRLIVVVNERTKNEEIRREVIVARGEARFLDVVIKGDFAHVRGRVVNASNEPVAEATVLLGEGHDFRTRESRSLPKAEPTGAKASRAVEIFLASKESTRTTDQHGAFDFGAVSFDVVGLCVSAESHAFWRAKDHQPKVDQEPMVIRLEDGVSVLLTVVGPAGNPLKGASVYALDRSGVTDAAGQVALRHLPSETISVDTFFASARKTHEVDTTRGAVTLGIDATGR